MFFNGKLGFMKSLSGYYTKAGIESTLFQGASVAVKGPLDFSYSSLDDGLFFFDGSFFSLLCLEGPDALSFVNGQVSSDVASLKSGDGQISSSSTPKGKILSLMEIYRLNDRAFLHHPSSISAPMQSSLETYHFCEDLRFLPNSDSYSLCFLGSRSCLEAAKLFEVEFSQYLDKHEVIEKEGRLFFKGRFLNHQSLSVVTPALDDLKKVLAQNFEALSGQELQEIRIQGFYPFPETEYPETSILTPELGQPGLISYTKGCFMGQEIFARIRSYGHTNKTLALLHFPDSWDESLMQETVEIQGKSRGKITSEFASTDGIYALGYLPTALKEVGARVTAGSQSGKILA
jgi:folate-binding protein YgfZ